MFVKRKCLQTASDDISVSNGFAVCVYVCVSTRAHTRVCAVRSGTGLCQWGGVIPTVQKDRLVQFFRVKQQQHQTSPVFFLNPSQR